MVIASIDIKDGKVVQLKQGSELVLQLDNAEELAREFDKFGEIAVIDLDAAMRTGENRNLMSKILPLGECRAGGGVRSAGDAQKLIDMGASKVIIGSMAFKHGEKFGVNEHFIEEVAAKIGRERLIIAVDAIEGEIVVDGWKTRTGLPLIPSARRIAAFAGELLFTSVENEGMMQGTDVGAVRILKEAIKQKHDPRTLLTVAGGVSTIEEIKELSRIGVDVQLGMALYTGQISLTDAFIEGLDWHKTGGMIPVIIQEERGGQILMTGYADREAVTETLKRGAVCLHSRTRNKLWMKGQRSGNTLKLSRLRADCDRDALLALVRASAAVCHTGGWSCFSVTKGFSPPLSQENLDSGGFLSRTAQALSPYIAGEQPVSKKIIKLNTNENPYPPPPSVFEAMKAALNDDLRLYPSPNSDKLRSAIAQRFRVKPANVFCSNGSDEVLAFAFAAFFNSASCAAPSEKIPPVLFPDITYSFYQVYAQLWNISFSMPPLKEDWTIDVDDYAAVNSGVIIPNPNAPTGIYLDIDSVKKLAEMQLEKHKVLIVDEAYIDFSEGDSAVRLTRDFPNLLVVRTFSKSASLAGLRAGYAIGSEELISGLCRIRDSFNSYPLDCVAQAGATAAVLEKDYYKTLNEKVKASREKTAAALKRQGWTVLPSSTNFIFCSHKSLSGREVYEKLREKDILVRHFDKERITNFVRVSMGNEKEMDEFIKAATKLV